MPARIDPTRTLTRKEIGARHRAKNRARVNEQHKAHTAKHPDRKRKRNKRYRLANPEKQKEWVRKTLQQTEPALILYRSARSRAEKRGLDFNIDLADVVIPVNCPILGIRLFPGKGFFSPNSPSLDRIDNTKGYIKGNIIVISSRANRLKSDATIVELIRLAQFYAKISGLDIGVDA